MRRLLLFILLISSTIINAQIPIDLKFDTNFVNAENHWVVIPNKDNSNKNFTFGYLYFDESGGGYSLQLINNFTVENQKFISGPKDKNSLTVVRLGNSTMQFALLSDTRIAEMKLEKVPEILKYYNFLKDDNEKKLERASAINGLNRADLALPILQLLKTKKYLNPKLYFELAFANNALAKYNDAENIVDEAKKSGFFDELLVKEKIFALTHNNKLPEADAFLKSNLSTFKTSLYKEESIANMAITYFNAKNYTKSNEWIKLYEKEFSQNGKYKKDIENVKMEIQKISTKQ